jgi:hypothetical protein
MMNKITDQKTVAVFGVNVVVPWCASYITIDEEGDMYWHDMHGYEQFAGWWISANDGGYLLTVDLDGADWKKLTLDLGGTSQ